MKKDCETLLDVLKLKIPNIKIQDNTLVLDNKRLFERPTDWAEFIMLAVSLQSGDISIPYLICLDDKQTEKAFNIIKEEKCHIYILGHPCNEQFTVWEVLALRHEKTNEVVFVGGENLRKLCDAENIYYRSMLHKDGELLSVTNLQLLKEHGEDCRLPDMDLTKQNIKP